MGEAVLEVWRAVAEELPKVGYAVEFITPAASDSTDRPRLGYFNGSRFFDVGEGAFVDGARWRPVRFYMPAAEDQAQSDRVWESTRAFLQGFGPGTQQIWSLTYTHEGRKCVDVVGRLDRYGHETILALLEGSSCYLCCTANRGVLRGDPILIGKGGPNGWPEGPAVIEFYPD